MLDQDLVEEFLTRLSEHYTAAEIVDLLDIDVWEILETYREQIIEKESIFDAVH